MKARQILFVAMICGVVALSLQACVAGMQLMPKTADPANVSGTYNLILYGCRYPDDLENMAILVDTHSPYPLDVYALDGLYKIKSGLSGSQALTEANKFLTCSMHSVWQTVLRTIPGGSGTVIGYELKPLYRDIAPAETLQSSYSLKDGKVTAYIRVDPSVEYREAGGGRKDNDH